MIILHMQVTNLGMTLLLCYIKHCYNKLCEIDKDVFLFVVIVLRARAVWWCIQSVEKCNNLKTNSYCCLEQHDHHAWQYWYVSCL